MHKHTAAFMAILAAAFYALNAPLSKLLLNNASPSMMAAFLYLGAGLGMLLISPIGKRMGVGGQPLNIRGHNFRYIAGMVLLDIAAPILLMTGLNSTTAANASLLNNFEIVATSLIAMMLFREHISRRLWAAIALITLSSILLTIEDSESLRFSMGSLFVLGACICWGLENNCTRMLSQSDPLTIVIVKGLGSGLGSLLVAKIAGESLPQLSTVPLILLLGFISYGMSVYFYVYAQRSLGAAPTSAYYAISPFIGTLLSMMIFQIWPGAIFFVALAIMAAGTFLVATDT